VHTNNPSISEIEEKCKLIDGIKFIYPINKFGDHEDIVPDEEIKDHTRPSILQIFEKNQN
jgi:hypothetical protein